MIPFESIFSWFFHFNKITFFPKSTWLQNHVSRRLFTVHALVFCMKNQNYENFAKGFQWDYSQENYFPLWKISSKPSSARISVVLYHVPAIRPVALEKTRSTSCSCSESLWHNKMLCYIEYIYKFKCLKSGCESVDLSCRFPVTNVNW